jgi:hypothetical protein
LADERSRSGLWAGRSLEEFDRVAVGVGGEQCPHPVTLRAFFDGKVASGELDALGVEILHRDCKEALAGSGAVGGDIDRR